MKQIINTNQLSLWNEVVPATSVSRIGNYIHASQNVNDEGEVTSQAINLLPITAKDGIDSLKLRNPNATGPELKALHKKQSLELKAHLVQMGAALQANEQVGGVGLRFTKNRVALVFKTMAPQAELLSDEAIAERMGQTVAWVRKHMRKPNAVIDAETGKELKPTPQNGTPELVPAKRKGKSKAPEAPATPAAQ